MLVATGPVLAAAGVGAQSTDPTPLEVRRIVPSGEDVPPGRQLVFTFDRAMVPLGRMERSAEEIPIVIEPAPSCAWRWLSPSELACQLGDGEALHPATRYEIEIRPGLVARDGASLPRTLHHAFTTQRPDLQWTGFLGWQGPDQPRFSLSFNLPVTADSVARHVYLRATERDHPLVDLAVIPDPKTGGAPSRSWTVEPLQPLGLDRRWQAWIEPGIATPLGPEPGIGERAVLTFDTFPAPGFAGVYCYDGAGDDWTLVARDQPSDPRQGCDPLHGVALAFTTPVLGAQVRDHVAIAPDLAGGRDDYDPWVNRPGYSRIDEPHHRGKHYLVWLPERLKAFEDYALASEPGRLRDEFGRALAAGIDMRFRTAHRQPKLVLLHDDAVLEREVESEVPLWVTNLDSVDLAFNRLTAAGSEKGLRRRIELPEVEDIAFATPLGVRTMLGGASGVLSGHLSTSPPTSAEPRAFFAQVTPFQVQLKMGHFGSVAWVTELATGEPIAGAWVHLYADTFTRLDGVGPKYRGPYRTDANGLVDLPGLADIDPSLETINHWNPDDTRWFVRIEHGEDVALLPLDHSFRNWNTGVWTQSRERFGHLVAWGTTAQGVYRAGDTIKYKIWARHQDTERLIAPPREGYTLRIVDPRGNETAKVEGIVLSPFGGFAGELPIPAEAPVGWYRFELTANFSQRSWTPLRVLVSDFTPSPFKVEASLNGDAFMPGAKVEVTTRARMHAGGPFARGAARVSVRLASQPFQPAAGPASEFHFDTEQEGGHGFRKLAERAGTLDAAGDLRTELELDDVGIHYGRIEVESTVRDDRGKSVAGTARAGYIGRDRFIGLRNTAWLHREGEPATFETLVVDPDGEPVEGVRVAVTIERQVTHAARVKGAGNAYLTRYETNWEPVDRCESESTTTTGRCTFTPVAAGVIRAVARIVDTRGREHATTLSGWVVGKGRVLWADSDENSLDIVPESDSVKVGDTARFLVRNPYPGARALVTVERYGVLSSRIETFDSSTPVIEVPIEADHLPGFYLSVAVLSPRVEQPLGPDRVDLGKPAYRMGYLKVEVDDPAKRVEVAVTSDRKVYEPRDRVTLSFDATPVLDAGGAPIELAVAVIDESVLDLVRGGAKSFDPYRGFYALDPLDVLNFSLLERLVGRQKFEKKGAAPGGDGGPGSDLRTIFDYVSYWNPSLATDADGRAEVSFALPDNLTGWRVLALALTPGDRFGLGQGRFVVNQATELRPVMPNQLTAGDRFEAGFTVLNRTAEARELDIEITARGNALGAAVHHRERLALGPFERGTVFTPVDATGAGEIVFEASAKDAAGTDRLRHSTPVHPRRSLETAASYGTTDGETADEVVAIPADAHGDAGGISVTLAPSVIGNVDGAFRYMSSYPYACWEQRLSKAVMASNYTGLRSYLPEALEWADAAELPGRTLAAASRFQTPSGAMGYWVAEDRFASPYLSAYTALAFNWLRDSGHPVPADVETKLHRYLATLLRKNVVPDFYSPGMASTVRAVALAALAPHGEVSIDDLRRHLRHLPQMTLFGKVHFLQAARRVDGAEAIARTARDDVLAHSNVTAGKIQLDETVDGDYRQLLSTPLRSGCAALSAMSAEAAGSPSRSAVGDLPMRFTRAIVQGRGDRDHFENTQENVFCMRALVEYSRTFEAVKPRFDATVRVDGETLGSASFDSLTDRLVEVARAMRPDDPGATRTVAIEKQGPGRVYYSTRLRYAPTEDAATRANAGIDIRREYSVERDGRWRRLESPMRIRRGELVRVDLFVSLPTTRHFVVVDDPVPGGLEPVNRDLANASTLDADKGAYEPSGGSWWFRHDDWQGFGRSAWRFYHQELRHHAARFFSDRLPPGNYHLSYTAQAIATGRFSVLPVRAEEMYDPDVYGRGLPATLEVTP